MPKQIEKTPAIIAAMQRIAGDGADVSNLPVWEAIAANTLPISKRGNIYHKSKMTVGMLNAIAAKLNQDGAPLHTIHNQSGELPIGKVFHAQVVTNDQGKPETRALFYTLDKNSDLTRAIDAGIIDEVSLGVLPQSVTCSDCSFDYLGPDAGRMNFINRTCPDGHTINEDGVHLVADGVDTLMEMSLVSKGAVSGSKIVSGSKSRLPEDKALHASGVDLNDALLFASGQMAPEPQKPKEKTTMDLADLVEKYTTAKVELSVAQTQVTSLTATVAALQASHDELKAKIPATPSEIEAKLSATTESLAKATVFLKENARRALVATASDTSTIDTMTVDQMTTAITEAQAKLSTLFPIGGVTLAAGEQDKTSEKKTVSNAYKAK